MSGLLLAPPGSARADDADTLTIGSLKFRLHGIDAPELDQGCLDAAGRFKQDEADASQARRGLWAGCFVAPWDFRKTNKKAVLLGAACPAEARARLFPDDPRMPPGCPIKAKYARRALLTGHRGIYHPRDSGQEDAAQANC